MDDAYALIMQLSPQQRQQLESATFDYILTGRQPVDFDLTLSLAFQLIITRINKKTTHGGARVGAGAPKGNSNAKKQSNNQDNLIDSVAPTNKHNISDNNLYNNINNNNNIRDAKKQSNNQDNLIDLEKTKRFIPPTLEQVAAYCRERNNGIDPQHFIDHYEMRNWIPKGATRKMSDWRAAVRTWERNGFNSQKKQPSATPASDNPFAALDN